MYKTKNKYHAVKAYACDGTLCDSKKEARRLNRLLAMQAAGEIADLRMQVPFELIPFQRAPSGAGFRKCVYIADFVYMQDGRQIVEDAKGEKTDVYKIKKKLMLYKYGIEIKES